MHTQNLPTDSLSILERAVAEPGAISTAYSASHGYSIGNQLLALFQCIARGIEPGLRAGRLNAEDDGEVPIAA